MADRCAEQGSDGCSPERGRDTATLICIGAGSDYCPEAEADERACDRMPVASRGPHAWIRGRRITRTSMEHKRSAWKLG